MISKIIPVKKTYSDIIAQSAGNLFSVDIRQAPGATPPFSRISPGPWSVIDSGANTSFQTTFNSWAIEP